MVKLVRGQENAVEVKVNSTIDYTGFSANLEVGGIALDLPDLTEKSLNFYFSASDVERFGENGTGGILNILDADKKLYIRLLIWFVSVDNEYDARGFQTIHVILVPTIKSDSSDVPIVIKEYTQKKIEEAIDALPDDKEFVDSLVNSQAFETACENSPVIATKSDVAEVSDKLEKLGDIVAEKISIEDIASDDAIAFHTGLLQGNQEEIGESSELE